MGLEFRRANVIRYFTRRAVPLPLFSSDLRKQWQTLQSDTIRPALCRLHYGFGMVAYSLSPAGAKKLLARVFPIKPFLYRLPQHDVEIENLSFDCVLAALYDSLNAYVCVPPLVLTNNDHGVSTIQEDWRQRRFWRLRRIKQSLFGTAALPPVESSFKVTLATDYPNSREYMRKYAHYLYSKADRFRAAREYLKHLLMRN